MFYQTIGPDKLNQLRHARAFPNTDALKAHMKVHASILRPKFEAVLNCFDKNIKGLGIATWTSPKGGYFINLEVMEGCAKRVVELCADAGLKLTTAGATYPYGKDPYDSNIRIAPSFPDVKEIASAAEILTCAIKYAALEKLLNQ